MDEISPELLPLFEPDPLAGDKVDDEEEDDKAIARLLEEDLEDEEEDAIPPTRFFFQTGQCGYWILSK